ncbi:MAG TPA: DsbA family protein [Longimicrobiaceae bacterium]|nr:DsbA family protein [Longimicrobiaceae bacterium]
MPPITIFSDFSCPFSYVTEVALRRRAAAGGLEIRYRAFEIYPAPARPIAPAEEPGWDERVRPLARELGVDLRAPGFRPRTRKAHEAYRFAVERGVGDGMRRAIFRAYWGEERDIGRIDVLGELIARLDVDPEDLRIALDIDRFHDEVVGDEEIAARLRVRATPTVFIGTGRDARIHVGALGPAALDEALASR